jgi:hypothetical protein
MALQVAIKTLVFQDADASKRIRQRAMTEVSAHEVLPWQDASDGFIGACAVPIHVKPFTFCLELHMLCHLILLWYVSVFERLSFMWRLRMLTVHFAHSSRPILHACVSASPWCAQAAINTLLTHDNIVNTYAHDLRPVGGAELPDEKHAAHWKL